MSSLSVVLPTLNERENLSALVPRLFELVPGLAEVIVVDDGSTDGTLDLVASLHHEDSRVQLIERHATPCLTASLQAGIDAATSEMIGWMDADQSMLPEDLARLADRVRAGTDLAVASRFLPEGRLKAQTEDGFVGRVRALFALGDTEDAWYGVLLSWLLNGAVLPIVVGDGVHDYTSGFAVARRRVFDAIRLRGDHGEYFIDLWAQAKQHGFTIEEIPYQILPRRYGQSKTGSNLLQFLRRGRAYVATAASSRRADRR